MDVLKALKEDHEKVLDLFDKFESQSDGARKTKRKLLDEIIQELELHTTLEEEIFYPAVRQEVRELDGDIREDLEEHHVVDLLIRELKKMDPSDEQFDAKAHVLKENVEHHIESEEKELFKDLRKAWDAKHRNELGERLEARKEALMRKASRSAARRRTPQRSPAPPA